TTPVYNGETPVKDSDAEFNYVFCGWSPSIDAVAGDVIYTAQYDEIRRSYEVTWQNFDLTELKVDTVLYGTTPVYNGETPVKDSDAEFNYVFCGWSPSIDAVAGDVIYTAQYDEIRRSYDVTWQNFDLTELKVDTVLYGTTPVYNGETPVKDSDAEFNYVFRGWSPSIDAVAGDVIYTAQYDEIRRSYDVTWQNFDLAELKVDTVLYGTTPVYNGETPVKDSDAEFNYAFRGWSPSIDAVAGDVIYTAQYDEIRRSYEVTWQNFDLTELKVDTVLYGTTPVYNGETPVKDSDAEFNYVFCGWSPSIDAVAGDVIYTAQYDEIRRSYEVTWQNFDLTELKVDTVLYGTTPVYNGETPVKDSDAEFNYVFRGWSPSIDAVAGDVIYTAQYDEIRRSYEVTWQNFDLTELKVDTVLYGTTPVYNGETPVK
ncbi:hypothetical protein, partial [Methanimicrococcus blatticola]|uniref:hypothetical protein n=1 Tax=Methanimicrococcus blatticola TaxID=91560 RepID=UPI001AACFB65